MDSLLYDFIDSVAHLLNVNDVIPFNSLSAPLWRSVNQNHIEKRTDYCLTIGANGTLFDFKVLYTWFRPSGFISNIDDFISNKPFFDHDIKFKRILKIEIWSKKVSVQILENEREKISVLRRFIPAQESFVKIMHVGRDIEPEDDEAFKSLEFLWTLNARNVYFVEPAMNCFHYHLMLNPRIAFLSVRSMTIEEFAQVIALWKSRSFTRKCPCFQTIVFDAWEQLDTLGFQMNTEREKILRDSNAEAEECLSVLARRYSKESHFAKLTLWVMPRQHCVNFKPN